MKRLAWLSTLCLTLAACGGGGSTSGTAAHDYNGTASVGDFLTVTIDRDARIIRWDNHTNGESGEAPFTVDTDGALLVSTDTGQVKKAYEIPGYGVVALDENAGPSHDRPSPVFLWEKTPAAKGQFKDMALNFLQFRNSGAFEVGCGSIAADGSALTHSGYLPEQNRLRRRSVLAGRDAAHPQLPSRRAGRVRRRRAQPTGPTEPSPSTVQELHPRSRRGWRRPLQGRGELGHRRGERLGTSSWTPRRRRAGRPPTPAATTSWAGG